MRSIRDSWVIFQFEFRRTLTWRRSFVVLVLAMFPTAIVALNEYLGAEMVRHNLAEIVLFVLIPEVICLMGLLLWAAPAIHNELEEKSWHYLSLRPVRRGAILFGKYLAAVAWTVICATLSLFACLLILYPQWDFGTVGIGFEALILLSSTVYGAIFMLLGVLFPYRALVAAVAYTALMEGVVAWLPATINHISIQYHLRRLLVEWVFRAPLPKEIDRLEMMFLSTMPAWKHLTLLLSIATVALVLATVILSRRQFVNTIES